MGRAGASVDGELDSEGKLKKTKYCIDIFLTV